MKEKLIKLIKQFVSFGLVGVLNTLLSLVIQWVFLALDFHYLVGSVVSFVITVAISYVLNNIFSFKGEDGKAADWSWKTLIKVYISYSITGLFLNSALLYLWNDIVGLNQNLSPVINLFFTIPINFILNKCWAYKK